MNRTMKRLCVLILCIIMTAALLPTGVLAVEKIATDKDCALTVNYTDGDKAVCGAQFDVYKVADVDEYARMTLTSQFAAYEGSVEGLLSDFSAMDKDSWLTLAATLKPFVHRDKLIPADGGLTDENGQLTLNMKPGLYLVLGFRATTDDNYTYSATPFMTRIPAEHETENEWVYDIAVAPKFEKDYNPDDDDNDKVVTRKALKIWDDEGFEDVRPESVTVQLLCDGEVFDTQKLSAENEWRFAWDNLDYDHEWEVVENTVEGYAVTIARKGITFTLTNKFIVPVSEKGIPVVNTVTGDKPEKDAEFKFVLQPEDPNSPMPEGSKDGKKEITITGSGNGDFGEIVFDKPGTYVYTVTETEGSTKGYTYDKTVYTVTYTVTEENGELVVVRTITDKSGKSFDAAEFKNTYKLPGNILPQTGMLWWPVPVLFIIGAAFLGIGIIRRRRNS